MAVAKFCWSTLKTTVSSTNGYLKQFSTSNYLLFKATDVLSGEPLKKKKRMDVSILIDREKKKKKKLEKEILKLERKGRLLKPIEEIEGDRVVLKTKGQRMRAGPKLTFEEMEERAQLTKEWTKYKQKQNAIQMSTIRTLLVSQQKALDELRGESLELYLEALKLDESLFPLERNGPLQTPPLKGYEAPDGDWTETTKKYDKR